MSNNLRRYVSGALLAAMKPSPIAQPTIERYVLRSLFYVKKSKVKNLHIAGNRFQITTPECWLGMVKADAFILDLEDSVALDEKTKIRAQIANILSTLPRGHQQVLNVYYSYQRKL
jgi:hypothetical protein